MNAQVSSGVRRQLQASNHAGGVRDVLRHLSQGAPPPLTCTFAQPPPGFPPDSPWRGLRRVRRRARAPRDRCDGRDPRNPNRPGDCRARRVPDRQSGEHRPVGSDLDHRARRGRLPPLGGRRPRVHLPRGLSPPPGRVLPQPVDPPGGPGLVRRADAQAARPRRARRGHRQHRHRRPHCSPHGRHPPRLGFAGTPLGGRPAGAPKSYTPRQR